MKARVKCAGSEYPRSNAICVMELPWRLTSSAARRLSTRHSNREFDEFELVAKRDEAVGVVDESHWQFGAPEQSRHRAAGPLHRSYYGAHRSCLRQTGIVHRILPCETWGSWRQMASVIQEGPVGFAACSIAL